MRPSSSPSQVVRFGLFEVDPRTRELRKNGVLIKLQGQPFQILAALLERPGETVTREELRRNLWPADTFVDFDNSVNAAVNRLREALGDSAENPRFIQTLPRRGYRFVAPVRTVDHGVAGVSGKDYRSDGKPFREGRQFPVAAKLRIAGATALAIVLALSLYLWKDRSHKPKAAAIRSIAVLPLENLTGDSSQEYFSDGMTDALITNLAEIKALRVVSRSSTVRYKGTRKSMSQIGRELNVDAVIEGTVVRSGERVRIDAQLIEAASDRHLWAGSYEQDVEDVLALQAEVARAVAREISIQVTPQEDAILTHARPVNKQAYEDYLRGRFFWNKRTEDGALKGIAYFERALKKDPQYAQALSGISDAYALLGFYGTIPPEQAYPKARAAASNALRLDKNLAEAHVSLADTDLWFDWNWAEAEAEFKRAIELNPSYDGAYRQYSNFLVARRRVNEALAASSKALELDPVSSTLETHLGWMFFLNGQQVQSIQQFRRIIEFDPNYARAHRDLAMVLAYQGNSGEAVGEARKAVELSEPTPIMLLALGYAYAKAGQKTELYQVIRRLRHQRVQRYVSPFYVAVLYAAGGDKDPAFTWLETAYRERSPQLAWLQVYPPLDDLRSDPRFEDLVRRVEIGRQDPVN